MRHRYAIRIVGVLLLMALSPLPAISVAGGAPSFGEYQLKAGFIYKFISFVAWPNDHPAGGSITIGILGKNPFGDAFRDVEGSIVNNHVVKIKPLARDAADDELKSCQLLYISSSEEKKLKEIFHAIRGSSILTIGDSQGFIDKGGMIGFVQTRKKRIGIEINDEAATRANLEIRSMLKRIAVRIIDASKDAEESRDDAKR